MAQRIHTNEILAELLRIFETDLKTSLDLKGIYRGELNWLPPEAVDTLVNGVWIMPSLTMNIDRVTIPRGLLVNYNFRVVYVRRLGLNENPIERKIADTNTIVEYLIDNFTLPSLTLTNGDLLWCFPTQVENECLEDLFVTGVAADLIATAFTINCQVRTNHRA